MLLDLPHVSMRLWPRAMDIDDAAHAVAGILAIHQWPTSCIVAHSFGTFVASRLCQLHPACVQATVRTPLLPPSSTPSPHCILGACNFARYGMLAIHHWPTSCAMAHSFGLSCPPACASFILPASRQQCAAYPSCTHNPGADISLLLHSWGPIHRLHFPTLLLGDRLH